MVTSVAFSPAGDFLATTHVNRVGIYLWANRAQYENVDLKPLKQEDLRMLGLDHSMMMDEEEMTWAVASTPSDSLVETSAMSATKWQTLLNIQVIKVQRCFCKSLFDWGFPLQATVGNFMDEIGAKQAD
jgi:U3 small nucleolar RNA-associated protein 21